MSRLISVDLMLHLAGACTTMAPCWQVTRQDGVKHSHTAHDRDLLIDGDTYSSTVSFAATALSAKSGLAVDNLEATLFYRADQLNKADVLAGVYEYANLDLFWANWNDLGQGKLWEARGWKLGEARVGENKVVFEIRSLTQHYECQATHIITPDCRYLFGFNAPPRSRCPVNLASYTVAGSVTGEIGNREFVDSSLAAATDVYRYGLVTWTSGNNAGYQMEVESYNPTTKLVVLFLPMPWKIEAGDGYTVSQGCPRTVAACKAYGAIYNFGGSPFVPDQNTALQYKVGGY
jgi:uncharacterized phage protein (TIGR02218 family)